MSAAPKPASESLLSVRDLHVTYRAAGGVPAVRGVSFDLAAGETLGLAGESGSGKSTLAGALLRLLPRGTKVTGEVLLDGEDVLRMRPGRLRAVRWTELAIVFQGALHSLNPVQRVGPQIGEAIELHSPKMRGGQVKRRVEELLEFVGLPARRAVDYPHQLSGGQRQRVLIALALACNPRLLIADEPTTALDVMVQAQVLRLLENLQKDFGLAVVFITHDLSTLASVCRRLAVMYAGRIVEEGPSAEVFAEPGAPVHARPRRRVPRHRRPGLPDAALRASPGDPPDPRDLPSGCPFHPRCPVARPECPDDRRRALARGARPQRGLRARPGRRMAQVTARRCSSSRGLEVRFRGRHGSLARAVDGVDLDVRARRGARARRRVRLRQDDARADDRRPRAARTPARCASRASASARSGRALRGYRRRVQMVFQDPSGALNPRQTIYEVVAEGVRIQKPPGVEEALVADALARAGLRPPERFFPLYPVRGLGRPAPARRDRRGDGARAEPARRRRARLEPRRLGARRDPPAHAEARPRDRASRILVVTHDLGLAWNIADRVAVMYLGRIVEQGTTEELLLRPRHPYTRALLSVVPEVGRVEQQILVGEAPDPTRIPPGCRFHPRCPLVASGEAARLGIEERCRGEDPVLAPVRDAVAGQVAACHATAFTEAVAGCRRSQRLTSGRAGRPAPRRRPRPTTWYASASERRSSARLGAALRLGPGDAVARGRAGPGVAGIRGGHADLAVVALLHPRVELRLVLRAVADRGPRRPAEDVVLDPPEDRRGRVSIGPLRPAARRTAALRSAVPRPRREA